MSVKLPHKSVPIASIKGRPERDAIMKLNENIAALAKALAEVENRITKLGG